LKNTLTVLKIPSFHILLFPVIGFATALFFKSDFIYFFFFNGENLEGLIQTTNQTFLWQTFKTTATNPPPFRLLLKVHFTPHNQCP